MEATTQKSQPHIAILSSLGMGHLIPLIQFSKRLIGLNPNFLITFIIPSDGSPTIAQKPFLECLPSKNFNSIFLPPVNLSDIPQDAKIEFRIHESMVRSLPALRDTLKLLSQSNSKPISTLVVDLFGTSVIDLAKELDISPYMFFPSTAMCLSLILHMPRIDKTLDCEFKDSPETIKLPGCVPLHRKDLMDSAQDRKADSYRRLLQIFDEYNSLDGILVNSFMELESGTFKSFKEIDSFNVPVYPVGPVIQTCSDIRQNGKLYVNRPDCLRWLDEQPARSVLFVSFGSGGTLSQEQLNELALGLEISEQRFLLVVRCPNEKLSNAAYFNVNSKKNPLEFLPQGFLERTKSKGLVVPSWAPQVEVLSHGSTGGFLTHCGWNSVIESMVHGVPLIAWPLYAEQRMNAILLIDDLKVAFGLNWNENGIVDRKDVANVAKSLIEGEEGEKLRQKMKFFKDAASNALTQNGSSTKSLGEVASKWIG